MILVSEASAKSAISMISYGIFSAENSYPQVKMHILCRITAHPRGAFISIGDLTPTETNLLLLATSRGGASQLRAKDENYYTICIVQICTPCAFISVIELPRIPAYCPKHLNISSHTFPYTIPASLPPLPVFLSQSRFRRPRRLPVRCRSGNQQF